MLERSPTGRKDPPIESSEHGDKARLTGSPVGPVTGERDLGSGKRRAYAYDPHLDPQLVWAGKAERTSFEVPAVSLHVHERIEPCTIIEAMRKGHGNGQQQLPLFEEQRHRSLGKAIGFYRHQGGWTNRLIAGDSLLVMNSLLEKEGMAGKVQMIYMDPPYGIKYRSNFQPFVNKREVKERDEDLSAEPEQIKAFRDTWQLGIHSYLTYLRDRLLLARELLADSGSIFVQIGDEHVHHVRELMDEVFGASRFVALIAFKTATNQNAKRIQRLYDFLVWYGKTGEPKFRPLYRERTAEEIEGTFHYVDDDGTRYKAAELDFTDDERRRLQVAGRLVASGKYGKRLPGDFPYTELDNVWGGTVISTFSKEKVYAVQTSTETVKRAMLMTTDPGDLVFDPTCGSGTTAYVAEQWGRRWITCDTSRVAIAIARQRLMTAVFDYYELALPEEGVGGGFKYKTVPHVTLKSIANNPEIEGIYYRLQPPIAEALKELNGALKGTCSELTEREVPSTFPAHWPEAAREPFARFHAARREMQKAMDEAILRHAPRETLFDQPLIDRGKVRVTGPFTVEAVPSPAVRSPDEILTPPPPAADASVARSGETFRQGEWRDELLKTGIRGKGGQFIRFSWLEPLPGFRWLHAEGETKPSDDVVGGDAGKDGGDSPAGHPMRVVVSFGPEYGPLEPRQVAQAIEEAQTLVPRPKLVVFAAFQFDPEAAKDIDEAHRPGMTLLKVQMNADLLVDDLRKKRASNESFWLIGQPDVTVERLAEGEQRSLYRVAVHGFDYYNPRTGRIESGGPERIALWMLDTDYDGRSLYPRQVFFPMAGDREGWAKVARHLKAEIDDALMEAYRSTVSLPFAPGEHRRIAVKIVDDRGIESLRIVNLPDGVT